MVRLSSKSHQGAVTAKARRNINLTRRTLIIQQIRYPKHAGYEAVCVKLIKKYPKLMDEFTTGYVSGLIINIASIQ